MDDYLGRQVEFVAKLVRLSQEGRIDWRLHEKGGFVGEVFGREIRIFDSEKPAPGSGKVGTVRKAPVLEILVGDGKVGHSIESVTGLRDLLASAGFRAAGIDNFMEQVLAS